jgi:hypothetical protein
MVREFARTALSAASTGNAANAGDRSEFRIVPCRNTRFTCMIAGCNVGRTLTAEAAESRSSVTPP